MTYTYGSREYGRYTTDEMLAALCDDDARPMFHSNIPDEEYPSHGLHVTVQRDGARRNFVLKTYSTGSGKGKTRKLAEPGQITNYVRAMVPADTLWSRDH